MGQALMVITLGHTYSYAAGMPPGWLILGSGLGLAMPTIVESATVDLAPEVSATGSAVNAMARQLGAVLGTAVTVVILGQSAASGAAARFSTSWWVIVAACAAGALVVLGLTPSRRRTSGPGSVPPRGEPAAVTTDPLGSAA